jgi:hypothetical protein
MKVRTKVSKELKKVSLGENEGMMKIPTLKSR